MEGSGEENIHSVILRPDEATLAGGEKSRPNHLKLVIEPFVVKFLGFLVEMLILKSGSARDDDGLNVDLEIIVLLGGHCDFTNVFRDPSVSKGRCRLSCH